MRSDPTYEQLKERLSRLEAVEAALKESEQRYRSFFEEDLSGTYISTPQGKLVDCNPAFIKMFGFSSKQQALETDMQILYTEKVDRDAFLEELRTRRKLTDNELTMQRLDGKVIRVIENVVGKFDQAGQLIEFKGYLYDVTEQKKLESQLRQAQKMEAIGILAGGIAHNFNNLLMGIQGNASLLLVNKDSYHPDYERLRNIEYYVEKGSELAKQLLGLGMGGKYNPQPININELISKSSKMFGQTRKEVTVVTDLKKDLWIIEADAGQMEQVLLNVYINAWQAMPDGGPVHVETENCILEQNDVTAFGLDPGKFVRISVKDTGTGIDEKIQPKIFDPFFTTKGLERGTGLGLTSAYGIIRNHYGFITVMSQPGQGTIVNMFLPAMEKQVVKSNKPVEKVEKGHETILLVDDEAVIIDVCKQLLMHLGYKPLTARSGAQALEVYTTTQETIDLVILDVVMPNMDGAETYDRLKAINPQVKVLLASGYSLGGRAKQAMEKGCNGFIQKPFNIGMLSKKIREILDQ